MRRKVSSVLLIAFKGLHISTTQFMDFGDAVHGFRRRSSFGDRVSKTQFMDFATLWGRPRSRERRLKSFTSENPEHRKPTLYVFKTSLRPTSGVRGVQSVRGGM